MSNFHEMALKFLMGMLAVGMANPSSGPLDFSHLRVLFDSQPQLIEARSLDSLDPFQVQSEQATAWDGAGFVTQQVAIPRPPTAATADPNRNVAQAPAPVSRAPSNANERQVLQSSCALSASSTHSQVVQRQLWMQPRLCSTLVQPTVSEPSQLFHRVQI